MSVGLPEWPQPDQLQQEAQFRLRPEDFVVDEELGFEPQPDGEHVWLCIRKRGLNTEQVAAMLARHAGVQRRHVSWSGLKDRHAVTTQWFSVHLPGKGRDRAEDWQLEAGAGTLELLQLGRFARKLKTGSHQANRFVIRLSGIADRDRAEAMLAILRERGAPNYFGAQRFGHGGGNLQPPVAGQRESRFQRSMRLSAWRSCLFNDVLAARVRAGNWNQLQAGDAVQFDSSGAWYAMPDPDAESRIRVDTLAAHPTGPLWGRGELPVTGAVRALEQGVAQARSGWCEALAAAGMQQERRALRLVARDLVWGWQDTVLTMSFALPRGAYATTLLSSVFRLHDQQGAGQPADPVAEGT